MNGLSKNFIAEIKQQLAKEKKQLQIQTEELKAQDPFQDPDHVNDNAAVDHEAQEEDGHERVSALLHQIEEKIVAIDDALGRTTKGTYGICVNCGKPIGEERLRINPTADRCMDCETVR